MMKHLFCISLDSIEETMVYYFEGAFESGAISDQPPLETNKNNFVSRIVVKKQQSRNLWKIVDCRHEGQLAVFCCSRTEVKVKAKQEVQYSLKYFFVVDKSGQIWLSNDV